MELRSLSKLIQILEKYSDIEPYVDQVRIGADSEREAFGFLPPNAYSQAAAMGKLYVAVDAEGAFVGHLLFGGVYPHGKVMQIYCKPQWRKYGVAKKLMDKLVDFAVAREYLSLSAKVATDLVAANFFYEQMGFRAVKSMSGGKARKRVINRRVRDLDTPSLFNLMAPSKANRLPGLGISGSYNSKTPIYAFDLNVLFDVGKQRIRSQEAGMVFNAGFNNDIRLVVAEEFVEEFKRTAKDFSNDLYLQMALQMNRLPPPKPGDVKEMEERLAEAIFPERYSQGILSVRDQSDLKHLSTAIHRKITGFITSENAILRKQSFLRSEFNLDVLGVSDFSDYIASGDNSPELGPTAHIGDAEISSTTLTTETSALHRLI
jgi:GNAT superfamily N-acetyltransferase